MLCHRFTPGDTGCYQMCDSDWFRYDTTYVEIFIISLPPLRISHCIWIYIGLCAVGILYNRPFCITSKRVSQSLKFFCSDILFFFDLVYLVSSYYGDLCCLWERINIYNVKTHQDRLHLSSQPSAVDDAESVDHLSTDFCWFCPIDGHLVS